MNDVVIDSIVFSGNDNRNGPSCVSGNMSMIKLVNISTIGNIGKGGGFLGMTTSTVTVVDSEFRSNVGFPPLDSEGSTLLLVDCNLTVLDTQFIENKPGNHGGVIMMKVDPGNLTRMRHSVPVALACILLNPALTTLSTTMLL